MSKRVASRKLNIPPEARKGGTTPGFEDLFSDGDKAEGSEPYGGKCAFEETKTFMQTIDRLMEEQEDLKGVWNTLNVALKSLELEIEQTFKLRDIAYKALDFQHGLTDSAEPASAATPPSSAPASDPTTGSSKGLLN